MKQSGAAYGGAASAGPSEPCVNLVADSAWEHAPLIIVVATSFVVATSKRRALANPPPW